MFVVLIPCLGVFPQMELNSRQTVSTEIAKALEETRRQKEELQTQVCSKHVYYFLRKEPRRSRCTRPLLDHSQIIRQWKTHSELIFILLRESLKCLCLLDVRLQS